MRLRELFGKLLGSPRLRRQRMNRRHVDPFPHHIASYHLTQQPIAPHDRDHRERERDGELEVRWNPADQVGERIENGRHGMKGSDSRRAVRGGRRDPPLRAVTRSGFVLERRPNVLRAQRLGEEIPLP